MPLIKPKFNILKFIMALIIALLWLGTGSSFLTVAAKLTSTSNPSVPQKTSSKLILEQQTIITDSMHTLLPPSGLPLPSDDLPTPIKTTLQPHTQSLPEWITKLQSESQLNRSTALANDLTISKSGPDTILNGETIVYTITITNNSLTDDATQITLADTPPTDTEPSSVTCTNCTPDAITHTVPFLDGISGNDGEITYTDLITWFIPELKANTVTETVVSIEVPCETEGVILKNQAFINYQQGGMLGNGVSNQTSTKVILPDNAIGLLDKAGWCADTVRNVYDIDWGDFDNDGYLDLVLASGGSTTVFRNNQGNLEQFWLHPIQTFDARWGDFDNDDDLDIISIGDGITAGSNTPAYLHTYDSGSFTTTPFTLTRQGFRIEPGNYDNDADLELAISYNVGNAPCGVELYQKDVTDIYTVTECLQADRTSAGLAAADFDNDGDLDLAINEFNGTAMRVLVNDGGLSTSSTLPITTTLEDAYGMAWGDYNEDGLLDLAVLFRDTGQVQVFRGTNTGGVISLDLFETIPLSGGSSPRGVDWADFDGDGQVELIISDIPPKVYQFNGTFTLFKTLSSFVDTQIWQAKGGDQNNDGDIDLVVAGTNLPSQIFPNIAPILSPTVQALTLSPFNPFRANSVAWGDYDGDGDDDLLFGAGLGVTFPGSRLYDNTNGTFVLQHTLNNSGFGPHDAIFIDANGDNLLDITIATPSEIQIYLNGNTDTPHWQASSSTNALAWADFDLSNDASLDLFAGNNGQNGLFLNSGLQGSTSNPNSISNLSNNTSSIAWGYVDDDFYPDIAIGNDGAPSRVYRNNGDQTFTPVWTSTVQSTRSIAWGDYDGDGDMDLAVGNFNQPNYIYNNDNGTLSPTGLPFSSNAPTDDPTTSLAWGDWNNDGHLDLAVGNYGEKDRVYANLGSSAGSPNLISLWESDEEQQTTDIAWGDMDNDGDLDLAVSQDGNGKNGVYKNTYVLAPHTKDNDTFTEEMPLPQNPSYLSIRSPGGLTDIFSTDTSDLEDLTIDIGFTVYDPDRSRAACNSTNGDEVQVLNYQYSWNGGGTWYDADVTGSSTFTARCRGRNRTITWNAGSDLNNNQGEETVSDNVRFRITIAHLNKTGPSKRASTSAVSPPFRVRNLTCSWPDNAAIMTSSPLSATIQGVFTGTVQKADGQTTFSWDFGDESESVEGQVAQHIYKLPGTYTITLTVDGPACPVARQAVATLLVQVENSPYSAYLPTIFKADSSEATTITGTPISTQKQNEITQISDLQGKVETNSVHLSWGIQPSNVKGYRVYRAPMGTAMFEIIADVPHQQTTHIDSNMTCGYAYYVTKYNDQLESLPSTSTYFSPPCH